MKRTGFKKKLSKPLKKCKLKKRTALKKESKQKISVIQRKLWSLCREIVRKRYGNVCYTCGRQGLMGSDWQTGHLWAKASLGAYLKYDLRVLRPQCFACNIHRGGMGADYYTKMLKEIGQEKMEQLQKDRQVSVNAMEHYLNLLSDYQRILEDLNNLSPTNLAN